MIGESTLPLTLDRIQNKRVGHFSWNGIIRTLSVWFSIFFIYLLCFMVIICPDHFGIGYYLIHSYLLDPFTLDRIKNRQTFCLLEVAMIRTCFVWFFRINYVLSVLFLDNYLNSKLSKLNEVKISDHIGSYLIHILRLHLHVDVSVCLSCVFFFFDAFACVLH